MSISRSLFAALMAVIAMGCASGGGSSTAGEGERTARAERNRIIYAEIQKSQHGNLHDFIRSARPQWFRQQAGSMMQGSNPGTASVSTPTGQNAAVSMQMGGDAIHIFVDGRRMGGLEVLRSMSVSQAREIRYYSQTEAASRFSLTVAAPAIEVITRTQ